MADIEKRLNKAAIIKGATWGTEANCGAAGCGIIPLNPGSPKLSYPAIEVDDVVNAFETDIDYGFINPSDFTLDFNYQWNGLENILLAMLMGTAGTPTIQGAGPAYLHTLVMKNMASAIFGTYAVEKGTSKIHVVPSFKVMKGTFGLAGGLIKASFGLRGSKVIDNSAVVTSLSSVTFPAIHNRAKMYQGVFRMNTQGGAALASPTDDLKPKSFSVEIDRKFDSEHGAASQTIVEPRENGKPTVKLTMDFSRMDTTNEAYFANWTAVAEKKADITITGALLNATFYYTLQFQFPRLIIEDVEYADAGIIPAKIVMRAVVADTAPTGMTGITNPLQINLTNTRTTDLLA